MCVVTYKIYYTYPFILYCMKATGLECPCSSVVDPYERKLKCKPNHFIQLNISTF